MSREEPYFGPGTTPERVRREIEDRARRTERDRPRPTTAQREAFFGHIAEEIKRAEAGR
jgi:hypothetical protein